MAFRDRLNERWSQEGKRREEVSRMQMHEAFATSVVEERHPNARLHAGR